MTVPNTFKAWLTRQRTRDDAVGTLARSLASDHRCPAGLSSLINYVTSDASFQDIVALDAAVSEYRRHVTRIR